MQKKHLYSSFCWYSGYSSPFGAAVSSSFRISCNGEVIENTKGEFWRNDFLLRQKERILCKFLLLECYCAGYVKRIWRYSRNRESDIELGGKDKMKFSISFFTNIGSKGKPECLWEKFEIHSKPILLRVHMLGCLFSTNIYHPKSFPLKIESRVYFAEFGTRKFDWY